MTIQKSLQYGFKKLKRAGIDSYQLDTELLLAKALFHPRKPTENQFLEYVEKTQRKHLYKITENTEITHLRQGFRLHQGFGGQAGGQAKTHLHTFHNLIERRAKRIPVAYLTNVKEFWGLPFYVDKRVLAPRPQTETLVETAIEHILSFERSDNGVEKYSHETSRLRQVVKRSSTTWLHSKNKVTIVDIGTGSGCIIISLIKEFFRHTSAFAKSPTRQNRHCNGAATADRRNVDNIQFIATDTSTEVLRVARLNAQIHRVADYIRFIKTDKLPSVKTDNLIIVSNLPYLDAARKKYFYKKSPELQYEPQPALFAKEKGFFSYRKLFEKISNSTFKHLFCVCETEPNLTAKIKSLISTMSFSMQKRRFFSPSHGIITFTMHS